VLKAWPHQSVTSQVKQSIFTFLIISKHSTLKAAFGEYFEY